MTPCDDPYPWLSDFLCDYVDGTMPPSEQAAFEEWLRGDPALASHVARLVQARQWCCQSEAPKAPCDFVAALHRRLVAEGLEEALPPSARPRASVRGTVRRGRAASPETPLERLDAASPALLMRSALLLVLLGAVVMARFGLHAEAERMAKQTALQAPALTSEQIAALATLPATAPAEAEAAGVAVRRPAARLVHTHAEVRGAVRLPGRAVAPFRSETLLRIRAGGALVP